MDLLIVDQKKKGILVFWSEVLISFGCLSVLASKADVVLGFLLHFYPKQTLQN